MTNTATTRLLATALLLGTVGVVGGVPPTIGAISGTDTSSTARAASAGVSTDGLDALERPARLVDSRTGGQTIDGQQQAIGARAGGSTLEVQIAGRAGLGAAPGVVVINLTATAPMASGFMTVWPCGQARPNASSLNFAANQTIANQAIARVGDGGRICVFTSATTDVLVDAIGTFASDPAPTMLDAPARLADTRPGGETIDGVGAGTGISGAGSITQVPVAGRADINPATQVALLNITATDAQTAGFVTVFPCGDAPPTASNLNVDAGQTIANSVIARLGAGGGICIFTSMATHLLVDIAGVAAAGTFDMLDAPARLLDTRAGGITVDGNRAGQGAVPASGQVALQVGGRAGVPVDAAAVILNVTATDPRANGFVTAHPCGTPRPNASSLNFAAGRTIAGSVVARLGVDGKVSLFSSAATDLLVDVAGWIDGNAAGFNPDGPCVDDLDNRPTPGPAPGPTPGPTPGPGDDPSVTVRVTSRQSGSVFFEVIDTSGRNVTLNSPFPAPTLNPRIIYVQAVYPAGTNGQPQPQARFDLSLNGTYRSGNDPDGCDVPAWSEEISVCIGFPLMDRNLNPEEGFRDIPNHAVDVSRVLDVILRDPTLVGGVDTAHIRYGGGSMGAISGFFLVHPNSFDPRIASMVLSVGFAPYWEPAFSDPANWNRGPKILMLNTMTDQTIPYDLARRTINNAKSANLTLVSYFDGGHNLPECAEAARYVDQWQRHVRGDGPPPDPGVFAGSNCAALGVQPGGTTGDGAAAPLVPR